MQLRSIALLALIPLTACATPSRGAELPTGAETAEAAGTRTREVQAEGKTGSIYARTGDESVDEPKPPKANITEAALERFTIELDVEGTLTVDSAPITLEALRARLEEVHATTPARAIFIRTANGTPADRLTEVIGLVRDAGFEDMTVEAPISSSSEPPREEAAPTPDAPAE